MLTCESLRVPTSSLSNWRIKASRHKVLEIMPANITADYPLLTS